MEIVGREPRWKKRRIVLHKNQILHDIDVLSYKLAEVAAGESGDKVASDSEDVLDGSVMAQLLETREASMRKKLTFCLMPVEIIEVNNTPELEPDFKYNVKLPVSFDDNELRPAVRLMHEYLVKATLMDWYTHIGTSFGAPLATEVQELESKVVDVFRKPGFVTHPSMVYMKSYRDR